MARVRVLEVCLAGLAAALLTLGLVSHTLPRYLIQAAPTLLALAAVVRGYAWSSSATIPIFIFWMILVVNAGVVMLFQPIVPRPVSPFEIPLMILIGAFSLGGAIASLGIVRGPGRGPRLVAGTLWFVFQLAAMALSVRLVP